MSGDDPPVRTDLPRDPRTGQEVGADKDGVQEAKSKINVRFVGHGQR